MRAAVIVFPGSNADAEMIRTLSDVVALPTETVWHRSLELPADTDLVAIPGGFSYGDYLRCGAIAAASPIIAAIRRHADRGGYVVGVCNGFQVLTETGLLPGALTRNSSLRFECRDVYIKPTASGPFLDGLPKVMRLPIAHAEGRYQVPADARAKITQSDAIAFKYCDRDGALGEHHNPNGSWESVAGVQGGPKNNILGLMPHPERMSEVLHGGTDGRLIFDAVVRFAGRA